MYVGPGQQTALARTLAQEAIALLDKHDLVTVPALARVDWRMNMLSAQAQLQAPFFLGGEDVWVASPTAEMAHERKLMTLRGNNRYFRSEEHTSELQSLMRTSYAVFCLTKKNTN